VSRDSGRSYFESCVLLCINKNTETLTDASNEVGLEINAEKTKYMLLSRGRDCKLQSGHENIK
jgi:hypothetical protein